MARIRTIKPEFWADEKLAPLDPTTRLVFLGLISMADDAGRLVDSLKQIDAFIFPLTDTSARESLANLSRMGRVERGNTISGQRIIQIVHWKHQKVDHPNLSAALPPIVKEVSPSLARRSRKRREAFATLSVPVPTISTSTSTSTSTKDTTSDSGESVNGEVKPTPEKPPSWVAEGVEWWTQNVGATNHGRFGKALTEAVRAWKWPEVFEALRCYVEDANARNKTPKPEWFAAEIIHWLKWAQMPATDEKGLPTPRGRAIDREFRP